MLREHSITYSLVQSPIGVRYARTKLPVFDIHISSFQRVWGRRRCENELFATDESRTNDPKISAIIADKKDTSRGYETSLAKLRSVGANIIPMAASLGLNMRIGDVSFLW